MKTKFNISPLLPCAALICGIVCANAFAQTSAPKAATSAPRPAPAAQIAPTPLQLADSAPARYEVKKGDTLWSIAARFLKSPWRWPEIWRMNKDQIRNPHWIHPGDVLVLGTGADGQPQLSMAKPAEEERPTIRLSPLVRTTPIDTAAIPAIPPAVIDPFLTRPLIVGADGLDSAPKIVGGPDTRVVLAAGYKIYALGLNEAEGKSWQIYRPGKALTSPGKKDILGYEAEYLGDASVDKFGEVSTLVITRSTKEIVVGDKLVRVPQERIVSYPPHAPDKAVEGRIIGLPTTLVESGRDAVLTLDVGSQDGMEIGNVLALYHNPGTVDVWDQKSRWLSLPEKRAVQLPDERIGLAFVFRVFDKVSYALVLSSTKQVELGDWVRNP
ncbi:MAG: LysM peptidoglycan-binding domain-containing protein [Betaproteobacteria bacterium]